MEKTMKLFELFDKQKVTEKWDTETKTPKSERGKYKGKTQAELKKMLANVKKTGPHKKGSKEYEKQNELEFALRAKHDWGKVNESFQKGLALCESLIQVFEAGDLEWEPQPEFKGVKGVTTASGAGEQASRAAKAKKEKEAFAKAWSSLNQLLAQAGKSGNRQAEAQLKQKMQKLLALAKSKGIQPNQGSTLGLN
jgi:hypothetical protein